MDAQRIRPPVLPFVYAGLVLAIAVLVYLVEATPVLGQGDGLSGVFLIVVTLPLALLVLLVPVDDAPELFLGLLLLAGLLQAYGLYLLQVRRRAAISWLSRRRGG